MEKKLNKFYQQMNQIKDSSIMKKTKQEKKGIFMEIKRREEERKRKEEDEELKISG